MSSKAQPTSSHEVAVRTALRAGFFSDAVLAQRLSKLVKEKKSLGSFIVEYRNEPDSNSILLARLLFLEALLECAREEISILSVILTDETCNSIQDVAIKFYQNEKWSSTDSAVLNYQSTLFRSQPAAVLHGLTLSGAWVISSSTEEQRRITDFLSGYVKADLSPWKVTLPDHYRSTNVAEDQTSVSLDKSLVVHLENIQRLIAIVVSPWDILLLTGPKVNGPRFTSASIIAAVPRERFVAVMKMRNMGDERAAMIHGAAISVDFRNEEAWLALLKARQREMYVLKPWNKDNDKDDSTLLPNKGKKGKKTVQHYNMTEMFNLESKQPPEGYSITSLSAYFVDLMRLLDASKCGPMEALPAQSSSASVQVSNNVVSKEATKPESQKTDWEDQDVIVIGNKPPPSLDAGLTSTIYKQLQLRRPDLEHLELSFENDNVLIDYIDLANEVMESYVLYLNLPKDRRDKTESIQAYNAKLDVRTSRKQENTILDVYRSHLSRQTFPLTQFPYNYSLDVTRSLLVAVGSSQYDALSVFSSPYKIVSEMSQTDTMTLKYGRTITDDVVIALERASAAEQLGLSAEDFAIITGESYWPEFSFQTRFQRSSTVYFAQSCPQLSTTSLWGYDSPEIQTAENLMLDNITGAGLAFIKDQFLPRSGMTLEELLILLQTQCLGYKLVVTPARGGIKIKEELSEMRLQSSIMSNAPGKLTVEVCQQIQSFLRLRQHLDWSMTVLDKALVCLKQLRSCSGYLDGNRPSIAPEILVQLSYIKQLGSLTTLGIEDLLPLWGDIDTFGSQSLYRRLFLTPTPVSDIFLPKDDQYLAELSDRENSDSIQVHEQALLTAFRLTKEEFRDLTTAAGVKDSDTLSLANVSKIYRHLILCKAVRIRPADCAMFIALHKTRTDVFESPAVTFDVVSKIQNLLESQWTVSTIAWLCGNDNLPTSSDSMLKDSNQLASDMCTLLTTFASSVVPQQKLNSASLATSISKSTVELFGTELGRKLAGWINKSGTPNTEAEDLSTIATEPKDTVETKTNGTDPVTDSSNTGKSAMTNVETKEPLSANTDTKLPVLSTLDDVLTSAEVDLVCVRLIGGDFREVGPVKEFLSAEPPTKIEQQNERQHKFLKHVMLEICASQMFQRVGERVRSVFPDVESSVIETVLAAATSSAPSDRPLNKKDLSKVKAWIYGATSSNVVRRATFYVRDTNTCYLTPTSSPTTVLTIDGVPAMVQVVGANSTFGPIILEGGRYHSIVANFDLDRLKWTDLSGATIKIPPEIGLFEATFEDIRAISKSIITSITLVKDLKLRQDEYDFLRNSKFSPLSQLPQLQLSQVQDLKTYCQLRDDLSSPAGSLAQLLTWLQSPDDAMKLPSKISSAFGWSESVVSRILTTRYGKLSLQECIYQLRDINELKSLHDIQNFLTRCGLDNDSATLQAFADLAVPKLAFDGDSLSDSAESLRSFVEPLFTGGQLDRYHGQLQMNKRNALVAYLLQRQEVKDLDIWDPNGLFEYFLIDVQMGRELQTSRTKQAISTIQLFVQRCLLGLEQESGILPEHVLREKWDWMQRFVLWEAARKLMLYPENWIEPALRDDKSSQFQAFETSILSGDLTMETYAKCLTEYVNGLNDISDLAIQAYITDKPRGYGTKTETYHFFASTKTAPYQYYYRSLDIAGIDSIPYWSPWNKIDVEIVPFESDWNGAALPSPGLYLIPAIRNRRLYLFTPQILLKTIANQSVNSSSTAQGAQPPSFRQLAEGSIAASQPKKVWEIKMAWTERLDGKWLPKKTSTSTLTVEAKTIQINKSATEVVNLANQLPSVASFHFYLGSATQKSDYLSISVGCWYADNSYTQLGKFRFAEDLIMLAPATQAKSSTQTLVTDFNRLTCSKADVPAKFLATKDLDAPVYQYGPTDISPLLVIPDVMDKWDKQKLDTTCNLRWTLSYEANEAAPTHRLVGLVYDVQPTNARSRAKFTYIPTGFTSLTTSENIIDDGVTESLDFPLSSVFKRAMTARDNVTQINEAIAGLVTPHQFEEYFGQRQLQLHELASPYALYTWEIAVHSVMLAMERLLATQQFETALKIARLLFDPTIAGVSAEQCWRFPPFRKLATYTPENTTKILKALENTSALLGRGTSVGVSEKQANPSIAHAAARLKPLAYMKRVMMKYIEILIAAGDEYFRQATLESLPLAIQRYIEASHILGPEPPEIPNLGKRKVQTWRSLNHEEMMTDMELSFPFSPELVLRSETDPVAQEGFLCTLRTSYFYIPPNPRLKLLRATLNLRLYNIRHCLDINGKPIKYALLEPSIDPGMLAKLGGNLSKAMMLATNQSAPMPNYRFAYLLGRAQEMCSELRSLGESFLSAREKKDAEAMSMLKARQDSRLQTMLVKMKKLQLEESQKTIESLELQRKSQVSQLTYWLSLMGEPTDKIPGPSEDWKDLQQSFEPIVDGELRMTVSDRIEMRSATEAFEWGVRANRLNMLASALALVPNLQENMEPVGVGVSIKFDAENVAKSLGLISSAFSMQADLASHRGSRAVRTSELRKQLQDRRLQANNTAHEIKGLDKQIEIQQKRLEMNRKDIEVSEEQAKQGAETEEWLRTKFTNEELYTWMENSVRNILFEAYNMTLELVKRAEKVFQFEKGDPMQTFIRPEGYWDSSRAGLLAGQNMMIDIKKMDSAYQERRWHDFEITKNISLRSLDPTALLSLRYSASAKIKLPEILFDVDFPGHYMRRIKSVSITIPCIVGPYTSVSASLTLLEHKYRVQASALNAKDYINKTTEREDFRTDRIPISSVAISSAQQDGGLFELDFNGERFLPFEGAGVISEWLIELPTEIRQFDYETISDVVMHVKYTSLDGGVGLKGAANQSLRQFVKGAQEMAESQPLYALIDLKSDYPNEWYLLRQRLDRKETDVPFTLSALDIRLPFWVRGRPIKPTSVSLFVSPARADWQNLIKLDACGSEPWKKDVSRKAATLLQCSKLSRPMTSWTMMVSGKSGEAVTLDSGLMIITYALGT